jgi:asparagine synthase (glutamine-hydrolysing)
MEVLPLWGHLYDEPFFDSSGIPTYLVSKMASEKVKVVLSADGGDELFSGYAAYDGMLKRMTSRDRLPAVLRKAMQIALPRLPLRQMDEMLDASPLPRALRQRLRSRSTWRARQVCDALCSPTDGVAYERNFTIWDPADIVALVGSYARVRDTADIYPGQMAEQMCLWDLHHYLPGDILAKVDRASMAVSIESREPLLDHRLVEFAFRLPLSLRRGTLGSKHLLRSVLYRHVPRSMVDRPKMGFGIPLAEWLRGEMQCLIDDYLNPTAVRQSGMLDPATVASVVHAFVRGDDHALNRVWTLLAFQMWNEHSSRMQQSCPDFRFADAAAIRGATEDA